jgi:hypothetical protein
LVPGASAHFPSRIWRCPQQETAAHALEFVPALLAAKLSLTVSADHLPGWTLEAPARAVGMLFKLTRIHMISGVYLRLHLIVHDTAGNSEAIA